jgi:hypothetical protein
MKIGTCPVHDPINKVTKCEKKTTTVDCEQDLSWGDGDFNNTGPKPLYTDLVQDTIQRKQPKAYSLKNLISTYIF